MRCSAVQCSSDHREKQDHRSSLQLNGTEYTARPTVPFRRPYSQYTTTVDTSQQHSAVANAADGLQQYRRTGPQRTGTAENEFDSAAINEIIQGLDPVDWTQLRPLAYLTPVERSSTCTMIAKPRPGRQQTQSPKPLSMRTDHIRARRAASGRFCSSKRAHRAAFRADQGECDGTGVCQSIR